MNQLIKQALTKGTAVDNKVHQLTDVYCCLFITNNTVSMSKQSKWILNSLNPWHDINSNNNNNKKLY